MISNPLEKAIHRQTDGQIFVNRLYKSLQNIAHEKGQCSAALTAGALACAVIYAGSNSYFCMEGVVRSILEVIEGHDPVVRLRPLGDVGGWTALTFFSVMGLRSLFAQVIREGEYLQLREQCKKLLENNPNWLQEHPNFYKNFYSKMNDLLEAFSAQCLFPKTLVSRRLSALEIQQTVKIEDDKLSLKDKRMTKIFEQIKAELDDVSWGKWGLSCLGAAKKTIAKKSCARGVDSAIFGVAIPIIFVSCAFSSWVGEWGLGKQLYIEKEELVDVGHFGEWPLNAVEALGAASLLAFWFIINEGNFELTRNVFQKHLASLREDRVLYNQLCDIGNQELSQLAGRCQHFKFPSSYRFEKI